MSNREVTLNFPPIANTAVTGNILHKEAIINVRNSLSTTSENSDEEKDSNCSVDNSQYPTVNVVNSSDVIIGSVTQFHGPVTIVQHVPSNQSIKNEANLVTTDCTTPPSSKKSPAVCLPKRLLLCFATITVLITLIILSVILTIDTQYPMESQNYDEENISVKHNISGHNYYDTQTWGGRQPLWETPITNPIPFVIISHTAGNQCETFNDCAVELRNIQADHVSKGSPNVGYNFLIGGDGDIYEGRGWHARNFHRDSTIGICFMGNYVYDNFTLKMVDAMDKLLEVGVILNVLPQDFQLVAHNQTVATLSPGKNVYEVIKHYPNFYPSILPEGRD